MCYTNLMPPFSRDALIEYTGVYWTEDGEEHHTSEPMRLEFIEYQPVEYAAGITNSYTLVEPPGNKLEENVLSVDPGEWDRQVCEQTGGHNYTYHLWNEEEPESACEICTRCGDERAI